MKEQILELRSQGKTYNEIAKITGASKGTISYHCGPQINRQKHHQRQYSSRREKTYKIKEMFGSECLFCGYNRCVAALEFHHITNDKIATVSQLVGRRGISEALEEANKCALLCSNCHKEVHEGLLLIVLEENGAP